jgi:hypothetical protein
VTAPPSIPIDRTEEWRRTVVEEGQPTHHTAMVDVAVGDYVVVSYEVLSGLLAALGFARIDNLREE